MKSRRIASAPAAAAGSGRAVFSRRFVAFQTVFYFHLHVIPRYAGDGWTIIPETAERERSLLDSDAQAIKDAIASTD